MAEPPLFYVRGAVYIVKFPSDEKPGTLIEKYALCLQETEFLRTRPAFVGVLLTTCKTNEPPRVPPWKVYVSPADSSTEFGALVDCGLVYTFPKRTVVTHAYTLNTDIMEKVERALIFSLGIVKMADLKKRWQERGQQQSGT